MVFICIERIAEVERQTLVRNRNDRIEVETVSISGYH
jgi:hypothetical protein